jgi:AraC family transcriptional regulator of arabinose operon
MMSDVEVVSVLDGDGCEFVLADHFQETDTYRVYRPNGMTDSLMTYTLEGQGYYITEQGERMCKAGDLTILNAGIPHRYGTVKGQTWNFMWVHFQQQDIESILLPKEDLTIVPFDNRSAQKRIYHAFQRILSDSHERGDYWNTLCMNALREILLLVARKSTHSIDSRIEEALNLMSRHMTEPLRIESLAKKVGLSSSRLSFLFKQHTGISIVETLNDIRTRQAALLIEHTHRNASEVAYDVGYNNYNHFIIQFRKRYGKSPSVYAKAHRRHRIDEG